MEIAPRMTKSEKAQRMADRINQDSLYTANVWEKGGRCRVYINHSNNVLSYGYVEITDGAAVDSVDAKGKTRRNIGEVIERAIYSRTVTAPGAEPVVVIVAEADDFPIGSLLIKRHMFTGAEERFVLAIDEDNERVWTEV